MSNAGWPSEGLRQLDEFFEEGCVCVVCTDEGTKLPSTLLQGEVL